MKIKIPLPESAIKNTPGNAGGASTARVIKNQFITATGASCARE